MSESTPEHPDRSSGPGARLCRWPGHDVELIPRPHLAPLPKLPPGKAFHHGRGLCIEHYAYARECEILDQFPLQEIRSREEVLAAWRELEPQGYTRAVVARELGMTPAAFGMALRRAGVHCRRPARATPEVAPVEMPLPPSPTGWSRPGLFDLDTREEGE